MSASYFKKAIGGANIQVTSHRDGGRSFGDAVMDADLGGNRGPRMIRGGGRPPRGRGRGRGGSSRDYNQHDDREKTVTERLGERLGFKNKRSRSRRGNNSRRLGGRQDGAEDKWTHHGETSGKSQHWYKVMVPYGARVDKDFIYKSINELLEIPFIPMFYKIEDKAAVFYVEMSFSSIEALKSVSHRITFPNGFKMQLRVSQQDPPMPKKIEGEQFERMLTTMSSCYDPQTKVLNLEQFHKQEGLKPDLLPINRNAVMTAAVNIIKEHIPELVALNLSNNRLSSLHCLEPLVSATPNMKGIDLSDNPELLERELDRLRGWSLTEVSLAGTPLQKKNPDKALYLSAVRKKFPEVVVLDGESAPPVIKIGIEAQETVELPPRRGNYFGTSQELVTMFVQQYYSLFDSDDRSPLIQAYHDNVMFSTSFWFHPHIDKQPSFDIMNSRNLFRINDPAMKAKRLKMGKQTVIDFFTQEFPKTKHMHDSMTVDVVHESPQLMCFTVTGLLEEPDNDWGGMVTRLFSRTFTTVPMGTGIVILSEQFSLSNVNKEARNRVVSNRKKCDELPPAPAPSTSAVPAAVAAPQIPVAVAAAAAVPQPALVEQVMKVTGMNAHWSEECLKAPSVNWDFNSAVNLFNTLKSEGKIPPEAFQPQ